MHKKKIGIFTRVSTKRQKEQGISLKTQLNLAQSHAEKLDGKVIKVYEEVCSVTKCRINNREVMKELINDIKSGDINYLITYKRDRLFRNRKEYMEFLSLLAEYDAELHLSATNEIQVDVKSFKDDISISDDDVLKFIQLLSMA